MAGRPQHDDQAAVEERLSPLWRIVLRLFNGFALFSVLITGTMFFLFLKFIMGMSVLGALGLIAGVIGAIAVFAYFVPAGPDNTSIFDLFD